MQEPDRTEYRQFLQAWQNEYIERNAEWSSLYAEFHANTHTAEELHAFDKQLLDARREFVLLFRSRNQIFRANRGLQAQ